MFLNDVFVYSRFFSVGYILNMTKEVDNFFPQHFAYLKIPVSDEDTTQLLNCWSDTIPFIQRAK